jgi:tetratricopeptide (TPR) repeat protein
LNKSARKRPDRRPLTTAVRAGDAALSCEVSPPGRGSRKGEDDNGGANQLFNRLSPAWLAAALIAGATVCAYANSLSGGFVYDDWTDVLHNEQIRQLWPLSRVFGAESNGSWAPLPRPLANLSFAIDYAVGGRVPFPFHLTNVGIHILAGLALFGIVRRTLLTPRMRGYFGAVALPLALVAALLWSLHPLNCQAVAYVAQRYESQMGLFFLVAIYAAIRCGTSNRPQVWAAATVAAALFSMGSKEVAVCLPIVILLYDRAFLAGSLSTAWRQRRGMYLGLIGVWALFALVQAYAPSRGKWAGFKLPFSSLEYALSQPGVILHYLRLAFWPHPLILDYEWPIARTLGEIMPGALIIGALGTATLYALVRRPGWGVLGAAFFLILAPTSSVMPIHDLAVEHRMYLPLSIVVVAVTVGGYVALQKLAAKNQGLRVPAWAGPALAGGVAIALAAATWERNKDFCSELALWSDTAAKVPHNARAQYNLGLALADSGQVDEAASHYAEALKLDPDHADAHNNLGLALAAHGRSGEAIDHYLRALQIRSDYAEAHNNLGLALVAQGRVDEAVAHYTKALEIRPDFAEAHNNLGLALVNSSRIDEAIAHYVQAVKINPAYAQAYNNFGVALVASGRFAEAVGQYEKAVQIQPDYAKAQNNLGGVLSALGRTGEALTHYAKALEIKPDYVTAHNNLGLALADRGRVDEAILHYQSALRLDPGNAEIHFNLAEALQKQGKSAEALAHWREAVRLQPNEIVAINRLAWVVATSGALPVRGNEAVELAERAVRLSRQKDPDCLRTLAAAYADAGRFPESVRVAEQAFTLAQAAGNAGLTQSLREELNLYRSGSRLSPAHRWATD